MPNIVTLDGQINFPFTAIELTQAVDRLPNMYGRIEELNLMPGQGVSTTMVRIDIRDGYVTVLPVSDRDGPASVGKSADRNAIYLEIPHVPHIDKLTVGDIQDMLAFASNPMRPVTFEEKLAEKLQNIKNKHAITREYFRMGALKGKIVDGAGTELHDLYDRFGIVKKTVDFKLNVADTNVHEKCMEVVRHIEENLRGEVMGSVRALVSREFFSALTSHKNVEKFYVNWQAAAALAGDARKGFEFGGIIFEEYNASATLMNGSSGRFIAQGEGHGFPVGTMNTFKTFDGPVNNIGMANMPGVEVYISPKVLDHGEGVELKSESNPLPVCARPELLVELKAE